MSENESETPMEQPEDEAPAVEEPDEAKHDEAEAEQPQQDEEYYEGNEDEDQDGYGGYEDDDFHYEKRMRGGFRGGRGRRSEDEDWNGGPRFNGPRGFPPRGRGYGPGGPPGRGFRYPHPGWRGRGGRGGFGGWRDDGWDGRGPPPNWGMGPPGFMGPGMPPPMMGGPGMGMGPFGPMPFGPMEDMWVETKSPEGKPYYYHSKTRETQWTKPDGPNIKIMPQEQFEQWVTAMTQMNQAHQMGPMPNMYQMGPGGAMGPMASGGEDECKEGTTAEEATASHVNGDADAAMANYQYPGYNMQQNYNYGVPWAMPTPGGAPPVQPPQQQQPPQQSAVTVAAAPTVNKTEAEAAAMELQIMDPQIIQRASHWSEHKAPDGRPYFYNSKTSESVWEKPQALKDFETARLAAAQGISTVAAPSTGPGPIPQQHPTPEMVTPQPRHPNPQPMQTDPDDFEAKRLEMEAEAAIKAMEMRRLEEEEKRKKREEEEKQAEQKKQVDRARPVTSTQVPGTPWCVVWTGDGRVFFYNPSTRTSVWERPEDLLCRADVDKLVASPPDSVVENANSALTAAGAKRPDSSDDEATPAKKQKTDAGKDDLKPRATQIDIGKESAIEAEVRAARERAVVPLETRIKSFREMLAEKEVSAFSTWEKELHKIVFDSRYLLLTSKERKQVFDKYVKERADEERREKRNKMRERKEDFRRLMESANLHGKSSFSDFASKYGKDERYRNIEKVRERESLFNEYILEVRKREKEEKAARRDQVKKDFMQLLKEVPDVDRHTRYSDLKKKIGSDPRYKAVDSSNQREDWFRDFIKQLKDERRRDKEKEKRDKEKDRERKDKDKEGKEGKEKKDGDKKEEKKEERDENGKPADTKSEKSDGEFNDHGSDEERAKAEKDREKQARVNASLREREKEVQRTLATHLRDRDKEREQHKHDEAVQHFNALLADLVRNPDSSWREAKKIMRKDHRWELAEQLERDEKEALFAAHVEQLIFKKREKFRELLSETSEVSLTSSWKEIKKIIKEDPRYSKFSSSERKLEREFKDYIKDKLIIAKTDFRELLQETKMITHHSFKIVQENELHLHEIEEILKNDKRYLVLDHIPDERSQLILGFLEDLEKRGPPPPPTASEPNRRNK